MSDSFTPNLSMQLCFVGPMVGRNEGYVVTQGEVLSHLLASEGYSVTSVSSSRNRYVRLADIAFTLLMHRGIDTQCLQVFGGPSFFVEDVASWIGRRLGHRIIMVLHGGALPAFIGKFPGWASRVLSRADVLVTPSNYLARAVLKYGFEARVIPNVIDLSLYPYRARQVVKPRLFWMRSFHPIYNPSMAIKVLAGLRKTYPEATLIMAGQDKGTRREVRQLAYELGVEQAVFFPGFLDSKGKARQGSNADIFINTNRVDNMPVAILEACAMGLPVVSTAIGGIPDLLTDGETGLFVPDDDHEAMTGAIERLLSDPMLAARLSLNGRKLAERSSWEQVRPQWEQIFAEFANCEL